MQVALLEQVEEKRARIAREAAAKQAEDEVDRINVLKALAYERAVSRGRYDQVQ